MPDKRYVQLTRREFAGTAGAGLMLTLWGDAVPAQSRGVGTLRARLHIDEGGAITIFTGKVDIGQDSRTEVTMAAAEEMRVAPDRVRVVMGDTARTPDDGGTSGSRTTPYTIPDIRRAAAAARTVLTQTAAKQWAMSASRLEIDNGEARDRETNRRFSYADLARLGEWVEALDGTVPDEIELRPPAEWTVMGTSQDKIVGREIVTGQHSYPSDIRRPGMVYGKVLRPPSYGAALTEVDLAPAKEMDGVTAVRDGDFVGCTAQTSWQADQAVKAIAATARWNAPAHPSSGNLSAHLKERAQSSGNLQRTEQRGSLNAALSRADRVVQASYSVPYIQHAPMEPRAAVAEWRDGQVTVWTGTQNPRRVQRQVAEAFQMPLDKVRVLVPDTGGAFGGKHTGETAVESARLSKAAGRPVSLRWTRAEEFTWAYFRPAGVFEIRAGLRKDGLISGWDFTTYNAGAAGLISPYRIEDRRERFLPCDSPLREGSYRTLAAPTNNFAREAFMDELAANAGMDPLEFRLANASDERLRQVLLAAAGRFGWKRRRAERKPGIGIGIAGGTEKRSYVAACVEVEVDRAAKTLKVREVCEVFECGKVVHPENLRAQVEGCILMGLGGALTEEIEFEGGQITNGRFARYPVPRMRDMPVLDIVLLDRPDIPSAGGGETPNIVVAPAAANAVYDAAGVRLRSLPLCQELARS